MHRWFILSVGESDQVLLVSGTRVYESAEKCKKQRGEGSKKLLDLLEPSVAECI